MGGAETGGENHAHYCVSSTEQTGSDRQTSPQQVRARALTKNDNIVVLYDYHVSAMHVIVDM